MSKALQEKINELFEATKNPHQLAKVGHQGASTFYLFVVAVGCSGGIRLFSRGYPL